MLIIANKLFKLPNLANVNGLKSCRLNRSQHQIQTTFCTYKLPYYQFFDNFIIEFYKGSQYIKRHILKNGTLRYARLFEVLFSSIQKKNIEILILRPKAQGSSFIYPFVSVTINNLDLFLNGAPGTHLHTNWRWFYAPCIAWKPESKFEVKS